jgi:16S rRNA processing protein RimM
MDQPTVAVGRVGRPHGINGEVGVLVLSEVPSRFDVGEVVWLEDGRTLTVERSKSHRAGLLVKFREVADRTQAEALRSALLVVPESMSPELPEGSWWDHRILGCVVETDTGRYLGTVDDVIHTAANDVWSVLDEDGTETLIPVLKDVLVSVDIDAERIVVKEIPGLTVE